MNQSAKTSSSNVMDVIRDCSPMRPKLTKVSEKQPKFVMDQVNQLRKTDELCDVVLIIGASRIRAHKIVLAASSPYFRAMFTGELAESKQAEIVIRDVDEQAMELLVDFCYTSKITIDEKSVQTLLPAACQLQLLEVQNYCSEFLSSQLDPTNCLGIRAFADTHSCGELLKQADKYMRNNFAEVVESEEFLLLPIDHLIEIIASDELNVHNEEQVYQAVMVWINHDLDERQRLLPLLLTHVRLPLIDTKYLVKFICNEPLIRQDPVCRDLIDEAKDYHLLPQDRALMQGPRTKPRKPLANTYEIVFAAGGWCSGDAISSVEMYDPQIPKSEWKLVSSMNKRRCGVGVGVLNQQLYAVGGHDGSSYLNSVERYDPLTNQWYMDVAPTTSCRTSVGVVVLDNHLYAIGGQDGVSCLSFVEKYDLQTNRWSRVASMNQKRLGVAVAVLNNKVYAIGGSDGSTPLNTVEQYDPLTDKWTYVASMSSARKHLGCAVFKNYIYAVGGRNEESELNTVEKYNPQLNKWTMATPMKSKRSGVGLAVVNNHYLMAIGGFDGSSYLKSIEIYDSELDTWKLSGSSGGSMIFRRLGGGVGVLRLDPNDSVLFKNNSKANTTNSNNNNTNQNNDANNKSTSLGRHAISVSSSTTASAFGPTMHTSFQPSILNPSPLLNQRNSGYFNNQMMPSLMYENMPSSMATNMTQTLTAFNNLSFADRQFNHHPVVSSTINSTSSGSGSSSPTSLNNCSIHNTTNIASNNTNTTSSSLSASLPATSTASSTPPNNASGISTISNLKLLDI